VQLAPASEQAIGRLLHVLARWLVFVGGTVLCAIALLTVVSVIGRALTGFGLSAVPGDFELVEIGAAVAVFSFLPWCQLNRGHVTVDILVRVFPWRIRKLLEFIGNLGIGMIAVVIAWRLWMGMGERVTWFSQSLRDLLGFGYKPFSIETTFILGMPTWYGYALGMVGATLFCLVSLYTIWRSLNECLAPVPADAKVVDSIDLSSSK
jgi:TRAP-type C4-dicarboxylate transport system permease small subunit